VERDEDHVDRRAIRRERQDEFGDQPRIGRITIKVRVINSQQPEFRLLALGFGDQAVGSVTIDQLTFQTGGGRRYDYKFRALRDFEKWAADFMHVSLTTNGELLATRVKSNTFMERVDRGVQKDGQWNGKNVHGQISTGNHKVQVRVWKTVSGHRGGDWVARISDQEVQVR